VGLSEGTMRGRREKEKVREWKILKQSSTCEHNTMYCTINYWILGDHGDREWVSNGGY
jgi:hypothetical protein